MPKIDVHALQMVELFEDLGIEHLEILAKNLRPLSIDAGELLVEEGVTTQGPLLLILEGRVQVSAKDAKGDAHVIATLEPSTVIGELEFLADVPSSATVRALDNVSGFLLPRTRFGALMDANQPAAFHVALAIGRFVSQRLAETNALLTKALANQPERLQKIQTAQAEGSSMEAIDAELEALLA